MSNYQITTIQEVMDFTFEDAETLLKLMDILGDHPDWSEATTRQLRSHFKAVWAGE